MTKLKNIDLLKVKNLAIFKSNKKFAKCENSIKDLAKFNIFKWSNFLSSNARLDFTWLK